MSKWANSDSPLSLPGHTLHGIGLAYIAIVQLATECFCQPLWNESVSGCEHDKLR